MTPAAVPIGTVLELYAHAIAIEQEAAERYTELARHMLDRGDDEVGRLFGWLAALETEHLDALLRRCEGVAIPALRSREYQWLDAGPPETAARELVFRLLTPRQALAIALASERRAAAFFETLRESADDPGVRALAQEMAAEEEAHAAMLLELLARTPGEPDWEAAFETERG